METNTIKRLQLKYNEDDYKKKGSITKMVITRKSELNMLINNRMESIHQYIYISSKRSGTKTQLVKAKERL